MGKKMFLKQKKAALWGIKNTDKYTEHRETQKMLLSWAFLKATIRAQIYPTKKWLQKLVQKTWL